MKQQKGNSTQPNDYMMLTVVLEWYDHGDSSKNITRFIQSFEHDIKIHFWVFHKIFPPPTSLAGSLTRYDTAANPWSDRIHCRQQKETHFHCWVKSMI